MFHLFSFMCFTLFPTFFIYAYAFHTFSQPVAHNMFLRKSSSTDAQLILEAGSFLSSSSSFA